MTRQARILLVDDDESLRRVTELQLEDIGYRITTAADAHRALAMLARERQDLVITDLKMPRMSGLDLLKEIRSRYPETVVVVITAFGSVETAVEAMKLGAYDYITKPVHPDELEMCVARVLERLHLLEEVRTLRSSLSQKYGFENILGHSQKLLFVLDQALRAARVSSTVLIQGETGTGKELLARAIHFNSPRKEKAFITINCGAIPKDLLESELFGHRKGSFTGAVSDRKGKIELAHGGTVFLDEIGEMSSDLQVKLLRLIQHGEIEKVGELVSNTVDVRIVAATHRNLLAMIEDGNFREDLYYRLSVIPLELPPLREREEDIPELVMYFFVRSRQRHGRPELTLPVSLMGHFCAYRWPGNIRELENVIERLVVLSPGSEITLGDLPAALRQSPSIEEVLALPSRGISLEAVERELILRALKKFNWNQTQAAQYLDISRKALAYRIEKHGLDKETSGSAESA
jgi:two-component system NtrC family response regulator